MSNLLQTQCTYMLNIHQLNILASLEHRLEVAKAQQNMQLVALLEIEKRSINPISIRFQSVSSGKSSINLRPWLITVWQRLGHSFTNNFLPKAELQIQQLSDPAGNQWWYAYDPKTGKSVYADSDTEMRLWIESL